VTASSTSSTRTESDDSCFVDLDEDVIGYRDQPRIVEEAVANRPCAQPKAAVLRVRRDIPVARCSLSRSLGRLSRAGAEFTTDGDLIFGPTRIDPASVRALHCSAWLERVKCTRGGSLRRQRQALRKLRAAPIEAWPSCWTKSSLVTSVRPAMEASRPSNISAASTPRQRAFWGASPAVLDGGASELVNSSGRD
jgi:hypothetical protein